MDKGVEKVEEMLETKDLNRQLKEMAMQAKLC